MVAYLGYTLRMRTLFRGWPIMVNDTHTRRRRLQPKAPFDILVAVLHYCFFFRCSCSATAGRIFTESSPKDIFAVLFINVDTPTQSAPSPPKKIGGLKRPFFEWKFTLHCFRVAAAPKRGGILGKLQQLVWPQYLGYPHIHVWWTLVRRHLSYRGLISCAFWPMAHGAVLQSGGM